MKNLKLIVLSAMLISCMAMMAQAIPYYQIAGDFQYAPGPWNVSDPAYQFYDTGTGLYAFTTTVAIDTPSAHSGGNGYKITTQSGSWNTLEGNNSWIVTTTVNQLVTWYLDPNPEDPTWKPNTNVVWSTAQTCTTGIYTAVGLDTWLGSPTGDYDLTFSGATMHSIGNGIYSLQITFPTIDPATTGSKSYKVALNQGGNEQIGDDGSVGFSTNANGLPIASYNSHDTITLYVDTIKGKIKYTQVYPPISGSAPWYALGDISGAAQLPSNTMTNAGGGLYSFTTVATFSLSTHWVNVTDQVGNRHPGSSNTFGAFFNATTGQSVNITYDTNTHLDGWLPYTNFVYTSPTTTIGTHLYSFVGQGTFFGLSDWVANSGATLMTDTSGGNNIYTWQATVSSTFSGVAQLAWKVAVDQAFTLQIGSDGKSISGNPPNNVINVSQGDIVQFFCDVYKGRITAKNLTHAGYLTPSVAPTNGQPGHSSVLSASGGTPPYIGWTSSDTTFVQIAGFSGNTATVNYIAYGSSTITVYDSNGQTGTAVISTVPTSAPLAPESAFSSQTRSTILWDFKE